MSFLYCWYIFITDILKVINKPHSWLIIYYKCGISLLHIWVLLRLWWIPGGGGALRYTGGPHLGYVLRGRRGLFWRPLHVRDFVKEGYFFVPRYEVWGSKSPYNPRNIRSSDAEWLPKYLGFRVCCPHLLPLNMQRILKSKVKIRVPVHPMSVFW